MRIKLDSICESVGHIAHANQMLISSLFVTAPDLDQMFSSYNPFSVTSALVHAYTFDFGSLTIKSFLLAQPVWLSG